MMNVTAGFEYIFNFMGLDMQPSVEEFLSVLNPKSADTSELVKNKIRSNLFWQITENVRDPKKQINKWKINLNTEEIKKIHNGCAEAMNYWGYIDEHDSIREFEF
jgi:hypothetical protein